MPKRNVSRGASGVTGCGSTTANVAFASTTAPAVDLIHALPRQMPIPGGSGSFTRIVRPKTQLVLEGLGEHVQIRKAALCEATAIARAAADLTQDELTGPLCHSHPLAEAFGLHAVGRQLEGLGCTDAKRGKPLAELLHAASSLFRHTPASLGRIGAVRETA